MPGKPYGRLAAGPVAAALVAAGVTLAAPAQAASTTVVISEVYGGGGNTGATYTHDFVELRNIGTAPVDLTGWQVQYYSANDAAGAVAALTGSIAPGGSYLIQQAKGTAGATALRCPDATGTATMAAGAGRVDLVNNGQIIDQVRYSASNTTSASRTSPFTDTDDDADF